MEIVNFNELKNHKRNQSHMQGPLNTMNNEKTDIEEKDSNQLLPSLTVRRKTTQPTE